MGKIENDKKIVSQMIRLYCTKKHKEHKLCVTCNALNEYAMSRLDNCPYQEHKKFCSNCSTHCYKKDMREKIREVMKFSGPRMLVYHPILAIKHLKL